MVSYLSSNNILTNALKGRGEAKPLVWISNAVPQGCTVLLSASRRESGAPVVEVDSSKVDSLSKLNWLFINIVVREMLLCKDFEAVNMVFPTGAGAVDSVTRYM